MDEARTVAPALLALLALGWAVFPAAAAGTTSGQPMPPVEDEVALMRRFRSALHAADPQWTHSWAGWAPDSDAHPCTWAYVKCDQEHHITSISMPLREQRPSAAQRPGGEAAGQAAGDADASTARPPAPSPLLPELSGLQFLQELDVAYEGRALGWGMPAEWCQRPGTFPRLQLLALRLPLSDGGPLPDCVPGAFPALKYLHLAQQRSPLPAGWGASPDVLPRLRTLYLWLRPTTPLPPQWAAGFRRLQALEVSDSREGPPEAPPHGLPPEWAAGFPRLEHLMLSRLALVGTLPDAWAKVPAPLAGRATHSAVAFPALFRLLITGSSLSGTLPPQLFERLPSLNLLDLSAANFSGTLPDAWALSQAKSISLSQNRLSGPAFPPAWLRRGAMRALESVSLSANAGLGGQLPANLSWPRLTSMHLDGTGLEGRIPAEWCKAPFAAGFLELAISGTAVSREAPACAATALPLMAVNGRRAPGAPPVPAYRSAQGHEEEYVQYGRVGEIPDDPDTLQNKIEAAAGGGAGTAALPVVLPLAVLLLAGGAGSVLLLRRRRWRRRLGERGAEQQDGGTAEDWPTGPAGGPAAWEQRSGPGVSLVRRLPRRQRLSALLEEQLGPSPRALSMVPLDALPQGLAHEFGVAGGGWGLPPPSSTRAAARGGAGGSIQLAGLERRPLLLREEQQRSTTLSRFWGRWQPSSSGMGSGKPGASSARSQAAPPAPASLQWGLPTDSLRISEASELELSRSATGQLVELGSGSYSVVYLGSLQGEPVAVKVFELEPGVDAGAAWREVATMRACTHRRVLPLLGVAMQGRLLMVAMDYMSGGSLAAQILDGGHARQLRWDAGGRQVALDVAEALAYLHGRLGIMHSDLKPHNVLLDSSGRAYLADLGLALALGTTGARTAVGGSRQFAAPELLLGERCTLAADIFSFGVLLIALLTQHLVRERGDWRLPVAGEEAPQAVLDLIGECVRPDPTARPTAADVLARLHAAPAAL